MNLGVYLKFRKVDIDIFSGKELVTISEVEQQKWRFSFSLMRFLGDCLCGYVLILIISIPF